MNRREKDVLLALHQYGYAGQRDLAAHCGCSLGAVNSALQQLLSDGYIDKAGALTSKSLSLLSVGMPRRAVLLAAGPNSAPVLDRTPRALLTVEGEPLIERLIRQLHEVGITDICVVIGFQKERFEYLIDRYQVHLTVNSYYAQRHNLHSLALVSQWLDNAYVIPADLWFRDNPFRSHELYSWYMVTDGMSTDSAVRVNRKQELVVVPAHTEGNVMVGVSYLMPAEAAEVRARLAQMDGDSRYERAFWEATLYHGDKFLAEALVIESDRVVEATDREALHFRRFPYQCTETLAGMMGVAPAEITRVTPLKNGVINRTYVFECDGRRYVARFPRADVQGTPCRMREEAVYRALPAETCVDVPIAFDPSTGIKISPYVEHTRCCDPHSAEDVRMCMTLLRRLHERGLTVPHTFDLFAEVERFEGLRQGAPSVYADYEQTKERVLALRPFLEMCPKTCTLTHIDPAADNFLLDGETVCLIDWEYAAMQDPHLDVAMFCVSALQDRGQVEQSIDAYFPEGCSEMVRLKIYGYIAVAGLLWSNWCEYQQQAGAEFGEYSLRQYRYAKEYARLVHGELNKKRGERI